MSFAPQIKIIKMKKGIGFIAMVLGLGFLALSFKPSEEKETKSVNVEKSTVGWKAYKVAGSHEGNISLAEASLEFEKNMLVGGTFVIDMTTINCTDLEGNGKSGLEGHLHSEDFFNTTKFPKAVFVITSSTANEDGTYAVKGDMTIKDKTNEIAFTVNMDGNKASASLKVDRAKFNVKYGSKSFFDDLKDKVINDEFDLTIELVF